MVIEKVKLQKDIEESGLIEVGANLGDIHYQNYFKVATSNIDLLHVYARTWTNTNFDFIKETVLNKKCRLRIVLLNPESPFVPALEKHYGYSGGELKKYIIEVTKQWKLLAEMVEEKRRYFSDRSYRKTHRKSYETTAYGRVELYYYNGQPTNSLYRIDDKIVLVCTKTSRDRSIHIPYMIYEKGKNQNNMYDIFSQEMEKTIKEAASVNLLGDNEE